MTKLLFSLVLTGFLAACGGGGSDTVTPTAGTSPTQSTTPVATVATLPPTPVVPPPAPQPAPAVKVVPPTVSVAPADATLTEFTTQEVVMPGETARIAIGRTTCPTDANGNCKKQIVLGELGLKTVLKYTNVQFVFDGNVVSGVPVTKEDGYRLFPIGFYTIWRPDMALEVIGTLDPSTAPNKVASVVLQATDSNLDETLQVVASNESQVTVFAQANYAPAQISVLGDGLQPRSFQYSCATTATCQLLQFETVVWGAPNTQVRLYQNDSVIFEGWTDAVGQMMMYTGLGQMYPGQSTKLRLDALGRIDSVMFSSFQSVSGGKLIEPIKPTGCTIVTPQFCKG